MAGVLFLEGLGLGEGLHLATRGVSVRATEQAETRVARAGEESRQTVVGPRDAGWTAGLVRQGGSRDCRGEEGQKVTWSPRLVRRWGEAEHSHHCLTHRGTCDC